MNVLISGGGIAGLTLAFWLHRHGHDPFIVERSPRLREEGYMIDFFGPGYGASEKMGLLSDIEGIHYQIPSLSFIDAKGKEKFSLKYTALRKNLFGGHHFNFMRGDLENLLYSQYGLVKENDRLSEGLGWLRPTSVGRTLDTEFGHLAFDHPWIAAVRSRCQRGCRHVLQKLSV
jgi:hypothetical protein